MSNIIFLFSLPRSGSTWLQRLLASNSGIQTTSETWLLLPLFEVLYKGRALTEYNQQVAKGAQDAFFESTNCDRNLFFRDLTKVYKNLFSDAAGDGQYFLEKTPRNCLVLDEVVTYFPKERFIFLWRDPADIALSLVRSYAGKWNTFYRYEVDFLIGIQNMVSVSKHLGDRAHNVRYEDIRSDVTSELDQIYSYLEFRSNVYQENELGKERIKGPYGDKSHLSVAYRGPISRGERSSIIKILERLDSELYTVMGYDKHASIAKIKAEKVRLVEPRNLLHPFLSWAYRNQLAPSMHRWRGAPTGYPEFGVE